MAKTTSTPAFPNGGYYGMSLRDWFAGQALVGYLASEQPGDFDPISSVASDCYRYADAMLKERGR